MLGNGRLEAFCFDGIKRLCHIRGKLRKKVCYKEQQKNVGIFIWLHNVLQVWINQSDIILVGLRDYQDKKADVIMKYTADEARNLRNYGEIPENVRIEEGEQEEELVQFDNFSSEDEVDEIDQVKIKTLKILKSANCKFMLFLLFFRSKLTRIICFKNSSFFLDS